MLELNCINYIKNIDEYYFRKEKRGCVRCHAFFIDVAEKHFRMINKTMN